MNLFLMSSAIHVKHGVYVTHERLTQTQMTIRSINEHAPNSHIFVLDGGHKCPDEVERGHLDVDSFMCFSNSEHVSRLQESSSQDIVKNAIELMMFGSFLASSHEQIAEYDRVFKISGRYQLTDMFDESQHIGDEVVVSKRRPSQFPAKVTGGAKWQYMSRLWSWPGSRSKDISEVYDKMMHDMMDRVQNGGYIDIEHLLYKYLTNVKEVPIIGIEGNLAPNGVRISD